MVPASSKLELTASGPSDVTPNAFTHPTTLVSFPLLLFCAMAPGLGYDEQGSLATYFVLTFLSLVLLPSTLWTVKSGITRELTPLPHTHPLASAYADRTQH